MANKTLFISLIVIGGLLVALYTAGYLQNASNITIVLLFAVFALAFGLFYEFEAEKSKRMPVAIIPYYFKEYTSIY